MLPPAREHAQVDAASLLGGREVEDARAGGERSSIGGAGHAWWPPAITRPPSADDVADGQRWRLPLVVGLGLLYPTTGDVRRRVILGAGDRTARKNSMIPVQSRQISMNPIKYRR